MQKSNVRLKSVFSAIFMLLTIAISTIALAPIISAQEYGVSGQSFNNIANINVEPNPCGAGQVATAIFFLSNPPPFGTAGYNSATNFNGYTLKITPPTGAATTFGPFTSDATGGFYQTFTPSQTGNYTLTFNFPGQTINGMIYTAQSATTTLTVQNEPATTYSEPPVPTNYWQNPIYGEYRGWASISGNWLKGAYNNTVVFNPYTTGPTTAHITWAKQQYMGGIVGADSAVGGTPITYYQAPTYQSYWVPPLEIDGRLYNMIRADPGNAWAGLMCTDIATGKELWFDPVSYIGGVGGGGGGIPMNLYGQVFYPQGANGAGGEPYFWNLGTNWTCFDANTGTQLFTVSNVLQDAGAFGTYAGTYISGAAGNTYTVLSGGMDSYGSLIVYQMEVDATHNWMIMWNSTQLVTSYVGFTNQYLPPISYGALNWTRGIQWNVTVPNIPYLGFQLTPPAPDGTHVFATNAYIIPPAPQNNFAMCCFDGYTGALDYTYNSNSSTEFIPGSTDYEYFGPIYDGIITSFDKDTRQWYGYDENTMNKVWGPTTAYSSGWDSFETATGGYDSLFVGTYSGHIYAYNIRTGALKWTYTLPNSGTDTPYGSYPVYSTLAVANGCVFAGTGEHTPSIPQWPGGAMYCVNATTGDLVYSMSGWWTSQPMIADSYLLDHNCYDGSIYCFGKGQTATTVTTPGSALTFGQNIMITGSIMDASPGLMDYAGNLLWKSASTPAIADASMTQWMEYLYEQKPMPTNATGVPVQLYVLDSNNNYRQIGTTTSDNTGFFSFTWKPDIPGNYTVYAVFAGSNSYYSSLAENAFDVMTVPTTTSTPTTLGLGATQSDIMFGTIAIAILVVIIGVILAIIMLRKRP